MNRILSINKKEDIIEELKKIGVSSRGIDVMYPKANSLTIKLKDVKTGAANIIKQNMLSIGGDAAVARGVVNGKVDYSDLIILGSEKEIELLIEKLSYQDIFGIPDIRNSLKNLLEFNKNQAISTLNAREYKLPLNRTLIMGIANISPDSFYDGGKYVEIDSALKHIENMVKEGADIIDIGGQSTRPYSQKITPEEELKRIIPVLEKVLSNFDVPVSIDTYKSEVAKQALEMGVHLINDISGLRFDSKMADVISKFNNTSVVVMHIKGTPENMQDDPYYTDVIEEIIDYLDKSIKIAERAGINEKNIIIDPGIGFGKRVQDNPNIIKKLREFKCLGKPILVGCSNKSFIGKILNTDINERLEGTLAVNSYLILKDVNIIRVHEVGENLKVAKMLDYLKNH